MSERQQRIQSILEANKTTIDTLREWHKKIAPKALGDLRHEPIARRRVEMMVDGINRFPSMIQIGQRILDNLTPRQRLMLISKINRGGFRSFMRWYEINVAEGGNPQIFERIIERNIEHFAQSWE
jgi:hypothetical protein